MNLTFNQILARTENLEYSKEYHYNEQAGIGSKPSITAGGENLKRFPLTVKLHITFCNPKKIIEEIEQKAADREIINYFLLNEYIGDYVIEKFNVNLTQTYKDMVIYAEIGIDLLENPESITKFEERTKTTPVINDIVTADDNVQIVTTGEKTIAEKLKDNGKKLNTFLKNQSETIKNNIFSNVITAVKTGDIQGLSDIGVQTLNTIKTVIFDEIKDAGITKAVPIVDKYINNMGNILDENQREIIENELLQIPDRLIKNVLRG
ncbi:MAG: phage tail protein [Candidatus Gastranaerophilaceae bacterium]